MASPKTATAAAHARRERTKARDEEALRALHEAITDDLDAKVPYKTLMDITGLSRERLRLIAEAVREKRAEAGHDARSTDEPS